MRTFGIILLGAGAIGLIIFCFFDITVADRVPDGRYDTREIRVVNVGKISDREAGLITSATVFLAGAIFIATAALVARLEEISSHGLAIRTKLTKENEQTYRAVKDALS